MLCPYIGFPFLTELAQCVSFSMLMYYNEHIMKKEVKLVAILDPAGLAGGGVVLLFP